MMLQKVSIVALTTSVILSVLGKSALSYTIPQYNAVKNSCRRSFLSNVFTSAGATATATATWGLAWSSPANALPGVTVKEFEIILKDSAKSIQVVEFSGPKSETALIRLVDGTTFTITDLIESPVDPRSPLKLAATCREYRVPTKFVGLELAVKGGEKKKKVYMNSRVAEAAEKEKAKRERMAQDEADRLAALYKLEEEEAKKQMLKSQVQPAN
mmetsp:Transcript_12041/g.17962  ORF Transcript_12041/g.17962 Transcript_12041/m.17962 type:complete len:214 (-) Transcript_12041:231-872(-)